MGGLSHPSFGKEVAHMPCPVSQGERDSGEITSAQDILILINI